MRLELIHPPLLVSVDDGEVRRPALLLARRGERRYLQVSRGYGDNALCWVDAERVAPASARSAPAAVAVSSAPALGLPRALR